MRRGSTRDSFYGDRLPQIAEFRYHLRIVVIDFNWGDVFNDGFDFILNVGHQDRVIGRKESP